MITFTDKRLYPKGICSAQLQDPVTGEVLSQSDKFSTGNIQFSGNIDPLRAGLGNGVAFTNTGADTGESVPPCA